VGTGNQYLRFADAMFDVAADELKVYRGSVMLADNATFTNNVRTVVAPARVKLPEGTVTAMAPPGKGDGLRATPVSPWARFELAAPASEVELDGQALGAGPLSLMTSPGKHHARAHIGDAWREGDFELTTSGSGIIELPERRPVAPVEPQGSVAEADPQAIAAAIRAQLPKLRVCHEKWLKVDEHARGKVMMSITISPKGKVTKTAFTSDEGVPEAVNECLGRAARSMKLPASSEEVELELPVVLGTVPSPP
jgi:hypothetical protein